MIDTQALSSAADDVRKKIEGRDTARIISGVIIAAVIFSPLLMFIEAPVNGRFASGTGALLITWLAVAGLSGHAVAGALFTCKTQELTLLLEMANAITTISKEIGSETTTSGDGEETPNKTDTA